MTEFLHYLPGLFAFYLAMSLGLLNPGPNILAVVAASMGTSRKAGIKMALGVALGTFVWATLAVTGVTALMAAYAPFTIWIKVVGASYFLWLALRYARTAARPVRDIRVRSTGPDIGLRHFAHGLFIMLTNPKAILTWLALVSIVGMPGAPLWVSAAMIGGVTMISALGHVAWATLFSTAPVIALFGRAERLIGAVLGIAFGALGGKLFYDGVRELRQ